MIERKKIFAVSDIHGHYTELKAALDEAGFEPQNEDHLLVCCGDYFDRGTENLNVLKYIDRLKNKVMIRGNHEDMLLEIFDTGRLKEHNFFNGTAETITDFFGRYSLDWATGEVDFSGKTRMLDRATDFILETRDYFETEHYVFTHGWLPTMVRDNKIYIDPEWRKASKEQWKRARWTKWTDMYEDCDRPEGKTIVCGHVPSFRAKKFDKSREEMSADIFYGNGVIALDAGTYTTGKVNVLVIEDNLL